MSARPSRYVRVVVNGNAYVVEVGDLSASPVMVTVNGTAYQVEVADEPLAAADPTPATPRVPAPVPAPIPTTPVRSTLSPCSGAIRAPMPGNIVDVAVKTGDRVAAGQTVCALEAMKMKSAIRSPRAGVVTSVAVHAGQPVGYGDILLIVE